MIFHNFVGPESLDLGQFSVDRLGWYQVPQGGEGSVYAANKIGIKISKKRSNEDKDT